MPSGTHFHATIYCEQWAGGPTYDYGSAYGATPEAFRDSLAAALRQCDESRRPVAYVAVAYDDDTGDRQRAEYSRDDAADAFGLRPADTKRQAWGYDRAGRQWHAIRAGTVISACNVAGDWLDTTTDRAHARNLAHNGAAICPKCYPLLWGQPAKADEPGS